MSGKPDHDDFVGYRKPPRHGRFVKGKSGNPAGRPPRSMSYDRIEDQPTLASILKHADQPIVVRDGDKRVTIKMREASSRALWSAALKGNPAALKLLIEELNRAEILEAARIEHEHRIWESYIMHCAEMDKEAAAKGQPAPRHIPHPEDVIIEHRKSVRFRIVPCEEAYDTFDVLHRMRDILLMQHILDERVHSKQKQRDQARSALLLAITVNHILPPRMQIDDNRLVFRLLRFDAMPQRLLLKTLYQDWRSVGGKPIRGKIFPSMLEVRDKVQAIFNLATEALGRVEDEQRYS